MSTVRLVLSLAVAAAWVPAAAVSDGPLGVGTPGTFRGLFLEMPLGDARGAGKTLVDLRWWAANDWSVPTRLSRGARVVSVHQDAQADVLQLSVSLPWSRLVLPPPLVRVETTAELRLYERWGGWTDGPIEWWHGVIGSWNFRRGFYPRNAVHLRLAEEGGRTLVDVHHAQPAMGDLTLRTQAPIWMGGSVDGQRPRWALSVRADVKLPTGRLAVLGGSGGLDAGAGLAVTAAVVRFLTLHGQGVVRLVSPLPHAFPLQVQTIQWAVDLSMVIRLGKQVAVLAEDRLSSPLFKGGWGLPREEPRPEATAYYSLFRPYNQISGGVRVGEVTLFLCEDFTPGKRLAGDPGPRWFYDSNSPDVLIGLAWSRTL
ncbi:MAG TPA: hypothetical protein VFG59_06220 [Anaeromyxobacter sp.]|nr:hypothetical protein [Anaeromyxobacter sp.]